MARQKTNQKRRPIEREYLAALNSAVPLDSWKEICKRAADDALAGDSKAREWLSKWLLGVESRVLTTLAAQETDISSEAAADNEIANCREKIVDSQKKDEFDRMLLS